MTAGGSADRRLAILVITVLCGVLGGLLGMQWWYVSLEWRVLSVVLGAVISTGLAFVLTTDRPKTSHVSAQTKAQIEGRELPPRERPVYSWTPQPPAPVAPTIPMRPVAPIAQKPQPELRPVPEYTRIALPQAPGDPSPSTNDTPSDLIAQCPHCGEFELQVSEAAGAYAFQCRNRHCGNSWSWTPSTPWPPVVVRRNLPSASAPGGAIARWS